jgi:AraC-like DNA-binding protein
MPTKPAALHVVAPAQPAGDKDVRKEPFATAHDAVFTLVRILLARGISAQTLTERTGLAPETLADANARVPLSQFTRLWAYACSELKHPSLALELHERYPDNRMHFVAHLGMRCATMREAIEQWQKYAFLVAETDEVGYEISGAQARFTYRCRDPRYASHWFAEHYTALALHYARTFTGQPLRLHEARFKHADPGYREVYERVFDAPIQFGADDNALAFDATLLDLPFKSADPYLRHFLTTQADELMAKLEPEARTDNRVMQALSLLQSKGEALTLERAAQALTLSDRKLRQLLQAEGRNFREVLDEFRQDAAARYLRQGLSVAQTAYLLGFSEPSALQHAFKRWFNTSAGSYVKQVASGDGPRGLRALRGPGKPGPKLIDD